MNAQEQFEIFKKKAKEVGGKVVLETSAGFGLGFHVYRNREFFWCFQDEREAWEFLIETLAITKPGQTVLASPYFGRFVIPGSNYNGLGAVSIIRRYEIRKIDGKYQIFHVERRQCGTGPDDNRVAAYILNELTRTKEEIQEIMRRGSLGAPDQKLTAWLSGATNCIDLLKTASRGDLVGEDVLQTRIKDPKTNEPMIFQTIAEAAGFVEESINEYFDTLAEDQEDAAEVERDQNREAI